MTVCSVSYPAWNVMRHIVICGPIRLFKIFPHYLINGTIFEKNNVIEHKMYILIFSTRFV
jgi:hypothetical protein